jgi:tetratricopeptide (TPR) repeat protein/DNA-binding XRE family transcriptional regulator
MQYHAVVVRRSRRKEWLVADQHSTAFGELLRQLRKTAGLSIENLAVRAKLSPHTISDLELGKITSPRDKTVAKLAWGLRLQDPVKGRFVAVARGLPVPEGPTVTFAKAPLQMLPRDIGSFAGRTAELTRLADQAAGTGGVVSIYAIGGMAGVGKTALAVHSAHQLAARFPDGQIFVELNGHAPGQRPVDPADALANLLQTSGVDAGEIPAGVKARATLWRQWLAGRRVLLLLDDAADSGQVRPLLPGTAGSLVMITSRAKLTALEDAHVIGLDVLTDDDAADLLVRLADRPGLDPSGPALAQIAALCGNLPLALGMVGRRLHHNPAWAPDDLAAALAKARNRPEWLHSEDVSVAAAFALSYRDLTEDQRRMFRRLGLHPGTETDMWAAAALDGTGTADAEGHLQALCDQNMIAEPSRGRYRMHDLLREYALACAAAEDPPAERDAAIGRLLDFYLVAGAAAGRWFARRTPPRPADVTGARSVAVPDVSTRRRAVRWMDAERLNLQAVAEYAAAHGPAAYAIGIPAVMHGFLRGQGHWDQALELHRVALAAAEGAADRPGAAGALTDLADVQYLTGNYAAADASLTRALELSRDLGDRLAEANALTESGVLRQATGDCPAAEASLTRALELSRDLGDRLGEAGALNNLGVVRFATGNFSAAADSLEEALEIYDGLGDLLGKASALNALGGVAHATGEYATATARLTKALELYRGLGDRIGEAYATGNLGAIKCIVGDYAGAATDMNRALELYTELGSLSGQADTLCNLGSLQRQTGDYSAAMDNLTAAIKLYGDLGDQLGEAGTLSELGVLQHVIGDYPAAAASLGRACKLAHDVGERADEAESLNNLGDLYLDTTEVTEAREAYERALAIAVDISLALEEARALEGIGRCLLRAGENSDAASMLHRALACYQRIGSRNARRVTRTLRDLARKAS